MQQAISSASFVTKSSEKRAAPQYSYNLCITLDTWMTAVKWKLQLGHHLINSQLTKLQLTVKANVRRKVDRQQLTTTVS